jgi:hypothetical protein
LEIGDTAGLETCATGQGDIFIEQPRGKFTPREAAMSAKKEMNFPPTNRKCDQELLSGSNRYLR